MAGAILVPLLARAHHRAGILQHPRRDDPVLARAVRLRARGRAVRARRSAAAPRCSSPRPCCCCFTTHPGKLLSVAERATGCRRRWRTSSARPCRCSRRSARVPTRSCSRSDRAGSRPAATRSAGSAVLLPLLSPLVLGVFVDVDERSTAMEARAFGSTGEAHRARGHARPDRREDRAAGSCSLLALGALVARLRRPLPDVKWPL